MDKPDIISVLQGEGTELKQKGRDFWCLCPLHNEKTPSFKVNPEKQVWYCFSCCQGGDVITYVREKHDLSFKEVLSFLGIEGGKKPIDPYKFQETMDRKALLLAFREWERVTSNELALLIRTLNQIIAKGLTEDEVDIFAESIANLSYYEYVYFGILCRNDDRKKLELFKQEVGCDASGTF